MDDLEMTCTKCNITRPMNEFHKDSSTPKGFCKQCKVCRNAYRESHRENAINLSREYYLNNKDKVKSRVKRYNKTDKGIKSKAKACKNWVDKNPKKSKVRYLVFKAVGDGVIEKVPCEVCGDVNVHAHHCDYDKPLDVMWLCDGHHKQWHKLNGEGKNG